MTPILGIIDSAKTGNLVQGAFESIATFTANGSGTATFSSIPQTYKHLQLRFNVYHGSNAVDTMFQLNNNTGTKGLYWEARGNSKTGASINPTATGMYFAPTYWSGYTYYTYAGVCDIHDYTNTNKNKAYRTIGGMTTNNSANQTLVAGISGYFAVTSAVTSITIVAPTAFVSGTTIALYGIK